jgi:hypothetical protein
MSDSDLSLSSAALKNITIDKIQENFAFVVGEEAYNFPRVLAEFLSPRVCLSHSVDPSIPEYIVETRKLSDGFHLFMSLGSGSTVPVTQANFGFFLFLSREFGNSRFYISLMEHFDSDVICSQLHNPTDIGLFSDGLIGRISLNFYELIES